MKQAPAIPAVVFEQLFKAAQQAWQQRDSRLAIEILERARRMHPAKPRK